jgi:hypothetical protein
MSRTLATVLAITNLFTGYELYHSHQRYQAAVSTQTTNRERETYGQSCIDWFTEMAEDSGQEKAAYKLARSWRKHGQMVFEVVADWNQTEFKSDDALCVVDMQSGMNFSYSGAARDPWLFYK